MLKKIKKIKREKLIFIVSMIYLTILGILLSYNYKIEENCNLLFDADTIRVFLDATIMDANHYRTVVHPLFIIVVQPLVYLLKGLVINNSLSIIIISSFASSLSIVFIYKILSLIKKDDKTNTILSFIYLFSFANIIFTAGIETYNFAALFLIIMWYHFIKILKDKKTDLLSYIFLTILGILSFGITITNCIIFGIICFVLLISKKVELKKTMIIGICSILGLLTLNITQKLVWNNTPLVWQIDYSGHESTYTDMNISFNSLKRVIDYDYLNSMISRDILLTVKYGNEYDGMNYIIDFINTFSLSTIFLIIFYLIAIVLLIRNFKENLYINIALLLSILFNTALHIIYGNNSTFLYSLHFIYLFIILIGINFLKEKNTKLKKYITYLLITHLTIELIYNNYIFIKVLTIVDKVINRLFLYVNLGYILTIILEILVIIIISIGLYIILKNINKLKEERIEKNRIYCYSSIIGTIAIFFLIFTSLESPTITNRFLGLKFKNDSGIITPITKKDMLSKEFKEKYKEELVKLEEYEKEYKDFKNNHSVEEFNEINWHDYYYFGLANRRKIYYKPGELIDIETDEKILSFTEKNHIIVPNTYTVLIETIEGNFIKVYEDENGVHIERDGKETIIEGTEIYIGLYNFTSQKYANMKQVLYGEILFNIKDSKIYPNIIVYDEPWYRDAAITSMVLKRTNNTNLIKEWIEFIDEMYDRQNAGIEEADNLGELLYLLSTQEERNEELIDKIEVEAERIATNNPNGYYLIGKTDFGDQNLYQNLWYKLGIESVGRNFHFNLDEIPEDTYTKMTWWSDNKLNNNTQNEVYIYYPYLTYAEYHKTNNGTIPMNKNLYPLSWERKGTSAKYENYEKIERYYSGAKISPLHSWSASELLLLLLDETDSLQ